MLVGGHADNSLKVIATDDAHALETALGHCAPITCLGLSPDGSTLVTGSKDATVILWHILSAANSGVASSTSDTASVVEAAAAVRSTGATEAAEANASMVEFRRRHVEGPVYVLRGHVDEVICCCVNHELDLVVSSSRSRGVLLHSIARGRFLRRLPVDRADLVALSSEGIIVIFNRFSRVLQTFTENGHLVASKLLPSWEGTISSLVVSRDGLHAVIGTSCARPVPPDGSRWQSKSITPATATATDGGRNFGAPQPQARQWNVAVEQPDHSEPGMTTNPSDNADSVTGASSEQAFAYDPQPAIILLELYTLEVKVSHLLSKSYCSRSQSITCVINVSISFQQRQLIYWYFQSKLLLAKY
jgi:WD40 repeat protein